MGAIRLFLALSVVLHHIPMSPFRLVHAGVSVILFYIVSGFYMALVLNEKYDRSSDFYAGRVIRLFPGYLAMLTVMVVWFEIGGSPHVLSTPVGLPFGEHLFLVLTNIFMVGQDVFQTFVEALRLKAPDAAALRVQPWFSPHFFDDKWILIGQAWSLATELMFYAIAPLVVRSLPVLAAALAIFVLVRVGVLVGLGMESAVWGYRFFGTTIPFFLLGSAAYLVTRSIPRDRAKVAGYAVLTLFVGYAIGAWDSKTGILATYGYDSVSQWLTYIVFAIGLPFVFEATRHSKWDREIGELSYPVYLSHGLLIGIAYFGLGLPKGKIHVVVIIVAAVLVASAAMHYIVERPASRLLHKIRSGRFLSGAGGLGVALTLAAAVGVAAMPPGGTPQDILDPPVLVMVINKHNIVRFRSTFYAIPHGVPVNWRKDDPAKLRGVLVGTTAEELSARLSSQ